MYVVYVMYVGARHGASAAGWPRGVVVANFAICFCRYSSSSPVAVKASGAHDGSSQRTARTR